MIQAKPMIEANATPSEPSDTNRPVQTNGDGKPMIVDRRYGERHSQLAQSNFGLTQPERLHGRANLSITQPAYIQIEK